MKIGLIGTFDVENFGDCLFPELYQHLLSQHRPDAVISLYSPAARCADILSFDHVNALPAQLHDTGVFDEDALILIGGETVGVGHSSGTFNFPRDSLSAYLRLWMMPVMAMLDPDTRPEFFGAHCVGAIKMPATTNAQVADVLAAANHCAFRDAFSVSWITSGDTAFAREIDPMFLIDHLTDAVGWQALAADHLPDGFADGAYIAAQISMGYGGNDLDAWCDAVAQIAQQTGHPVALLPICHFLEDEAFLAQAQTRLTQRGVRAALIAGRINVKHTAAIIGRSAGYIGSSLHGAVTAVAFAKPLAVLGHSMDGKHEGSLRAVGISGAVTTTSAGLVACFETTAGSDLPAARIQAQNAARASFDRLLMAMDAPRDIDPIQAEKAQNTAQALHELEQDMMPVASFQEIKRRLLRALHRVPVLSKPYRALRMRQKLRRATGS